MATTLNLRYIAQRTPPDRNRYVDFLRALSILVVVVGHWLMAAPYLTADGLEVTHLLAAAPATQWATWLLQVMPLFFMVGGYANTRSWGSARRRGCSYAEWLRERLRRLLLPVMPLLLLWALAAWLAWRAGADPELLRLGSQAALVPTWFLATYVLIVALAPAALHAWRSWGWWSFAGLAAAGATVDLLSLGAGWEAVGWVNYLLVWGAVHQLGVAWSHDALGGLRRSLIWGGLGLAALALLVALGPYPVAMVGLDAAEVTNSQPPKVTLLALGLFQMGTALALEAPARRWLQRRRAWSATVAVNASIMTLYLWHLTALVAVTGLLVLLGGPGLGLVPTSAAWWTSRPLWLAVLTVATLPLLAVFGRFERPPADTRPAPSPWRSWLATALACAGLGLLARHGISDTDGLNGLALTLALSAPFLGGLANWPGSRWDSGKRLPFKSERS
jgi:peptidoglycan/LPS O-acetylase OafA/YrhL